MDESSDGVVVGVVIEGNADSPGFRAGFAEISKLFPPGTKVKLSQLYAHNANHGRYSAEAHKAQAEKILEYYRANPLTTIPKACEALGMSKGSLRYRLERWPELRELRR
jgi:hypothetical protein